ncbi:histone deacetylase family protein [Limobrevibacterium gyesilva]|uniref:Histone deacetylase family protein n=1 Tax=Limobrevibacterium gyesilva TaxID=2991712 RepID=A0AA42CEB3_9PROT|nr:histone deacetylase family protein [Limobrevibacterium gyesilva]MCW3473296.1 histone deacetylase family protein [Limobrevibacterium gyesilva]
MLVTYSQAQALHVPRPYVLRGVMTQPREIPARAEQLLDAVRAAGHDIRSPQDFGRGPLLGVHTEDYVSFLEAAAARWQAEEGDTGPVMPVTAALRRTASRPSSARGLAGWYLASASVGIEAGTWEAMAGAANCAMEAAEAVRTGAGEAYAICRPPGHHAYADLAGGYCYLNNAAIAAQHLAGTMGRVAVLDVDVHHGNGTQDIFYARSDVLFVSLHADPDLAYPFYAGRAEECGEGAGLGCNLNLPLPAGVGDGPYLQELDRGLAAIQAFNPAALVVSLGFDAFEGDSSRLLAVTTPGFAQIGDRIGALRLPTVLVQEGGYAVDHLAANLTSFLTGFLACRHG